MKKTNRMSFSYSLAVDVCRVIECFQKQEFYQKENYRLDLPKLSPKTLKMLKKNPGSHLTPYQLTTELAPAYDRYQRFYQKLLANLQPRWRKIEEKGFYQRVEDITGETIPATAKITCFLTRWGIGGNALPPSKIIIRQNLPHAWEKTKKGHRGRTTYREAVAFGVVELTLWKLFKHYPMPWSKRIRLIDLVVAETDLLYPTFMKRGDPSIDKLFPKHQGKLANLLAKITKDSP